jgi:hypothetical protein
MASVLTRLFGEARDVCDRHGERTRDIAGKRTSSDKTPFASRKKTAPIHGDRQERAGIAGATADSRPRARSICDPSVCLICGRRPSDAHHLRFAQNRALSRKVSDEFTVPLCRGHHREVHRSGDEAAWWKKAGIDPSITARALWLETHPLPVNTHRWPEKGPLPPR